MTTQKHKINLVVMDNASWDILFDTIVNTLVIQGNILFLDYVNGLKNIQAQMLQIQNILSY